MMLKLMDFANRPIVGIMKYCLANEGFMYNG